MKHPNDRLQRRLVKLRKNKFVTKVDETKKRKEIEHFGRVWKKLYKEVVKEQETSNELRQFV